MHLEEQYLVMMVLFAIVGGIIGGRSRGLRGVFWGAIAGGIGMIWGLIAVAYWVRPKRAAGLCAKCDYNLTGNVSGICPECGTPVPLSTSNEPSVPDQEKQ
jgi:hypothetical protein